MAKRKIALPSFFLFAFSIALLASSLSTEFWIESTPFQETENLTKIDLRDTSTFKKGEINFGLFKGKRRLNMGLVTDQVDVIYVICNAKEGVCMYSDKETEEGREKDLKNNLELKIGMNNTAIRNPNLMSHGLWLSTIIFIVATIAVSTVGAIFSVVNSVMTPVEFITGIRGLYVWNGCGCLFSISAMIIWAVQYEQKLSKNILDAFYVESRWTSENMSSLGYSFWLILGSLVMFVVNITLISLLTYEPWVKKQPKSNEVSNPEGIIMLY